MGVLDLLGFIVGASNFYTNEQRRSLFHLQVLGKFPCFNFQIATTGTGLEIRIHMISMLAVICGLQGSNLNTEKCCICWNLFTILSQPIEAQEKL
jgi:hypothetical protein